MNITAINVLIQIDGKEHIALINHEMAEMFVQMLGAFQSSPGNGTSVIPLPTNVVTQIDIMREELFKVFSAARTKAQRCKKGGA